MDGEKKLGDYLENILKDGGKDKRSQSVIAKARKLWGEIASPEMLEYTVVSDFRRGILTIEVKSSVYLQELSQFRKDDLEKKISNADPRIQKIKFKAG